MTYIVGCGSADVPIHQCFALVSALLREKMMSCWPLVNKDPSVLHCIGVRIVAGKDDELLAFGEQRSECASSSKGISVLFLNPCLGSSTKPRRPPAGLSITLTNTTQPGWCEEQPNL
jgi:hypothetical protein